MKMANLDKSIAVQKASSQADLTRNNPWYDAVIQCTTQVNQIETIIETKEIEIEVMMVRELNVYKTQLKYELRILLAKLEQRKQSIMQLLARKNQIILSGQTFKSINALLVLDRSIMAERRELESVIR